MLRYFIVGLVLWVALNITAQPSGAGIYKVRWFVDKRLTNSVTVNNIGTTPLSIPNALLDSVLNEITNIVKNELQAESRLIYSTNSNGKERLTITTSENVGGLPTGTKRQAFKTEYMEYYVKFKIIIGVNSVAAFGGQAVSYARLKPYVFIKMKAYGLDRKVKFHKSVRLASFNSIGSVQYNIGGVSMTNNNAITPEQMTNMVFEGLTKFKNKPR
jgi:hypothetical protein